jgi:hypothetical protein
MDAYRIALVIAGAGVLGVVVWVLAKLGKALIKLAEPSRQLRWCSSQSGWCSRPWGGRCARRSPTGGPA